MERIEKVAMKLGKVAQIGIRVNPDVDAHTHPHITTGLKECKFGIFMEEAYYCYQYAASSKFLEVKSIACHIGSQITDLEPFMQALDQMIEMQQNLKNEGIKVEGFIF
jgi:diaminopimelate decarboxylase